MIPKMFANDWMAMYQNQNTARRRDGLLDDQMRGANQAQQLQLQGLQQLLLRSQLDNNMFAAQNPDATKGEGDDADDPVKKFMRQNQQGQANQQGQPQKFLDPMRQQPYTQPGSWYSQFYQ